MFSVCLRHATNHLAEYEYPVHFFFFDRLPRAISLIVGDDQQLIFHLLEAFNVGCIVVDKGVDPVTIKMLDADVDEQ